PADVRMWRDPGCGCCRRLCEPCRTSRKLMSLQSVRVFLAEHAPDVAIIETAASTATVAEAAAAHGVQPGQIAKTLSLRLNDEIVLLVMGGDARIDNQKFKAQFKAKARMLSGDE